MGIPVFERGHMLAGDDYSAALNDEAPKREWSTPVVTETTVPLVISSPEVLAAFRERYAPLPGSVTWIDPRS